MAKKPPGLSPQEIAQQAGVTDFGGGTSELDELAGDAPPIPDDALGEGAEFVPVSVSPTFGGGVIGAEGSGQGPRQPVETGEAHRDGVVGLELAELISSNEEPELILEKFMELQTPVAVTLLSDELKKGISEYFKKDTQLEELVETIVFEQSRIQASSIGDEDHRKRFLEIVDECEAAAIVNAPLVLNIAALLAARINSSDIRADCLADLCKKQMTDGYNDRKEGKGWSSIAKVMRAFGAQEGTIRNLGQTYKSTSYLNGQYVPDYNAESMAEKIKNVFKNIM